MPVGRLATCRGGPENAASDQRFASPSAQLARHAVQTPPRREGGTPQTRARSAQPESLALKSSSTISSQLPEPESPLDRRRHASAHGLPDTIGLYSERFHGLLTLCSEILFNFPSRYLFTIGSVEIFSLRSSLRPA